MSRSYSTRAVALTIGAPVKWLDNLLSHHDLPGIARGTQGRERRITDQGLLTIEIVRLLSQDMGIPIAPAARLAAKVLAGSGDEALIPAAQGITLVISLRDVSRRLRAQLEEAIETVGRVPRGRPPRAR